MPDGHLRRAADTNNVGFFAFLWHCPGQQAVLLSLSNAVYQVSSFLPIVLQQLMRRARLSLEAALAPFEAVPHWGKLSLFTALRLCALYGDRLRRWAAVARRVDPSGKFRNEMLDRLVAAAAESKL